MWLAFLTVIAATPQLPARSKPISTAWFNHDLAKSPVPVEYGRGGGLAHDFDLGVGNDLPLFDSGYVLGNADDAVRVVSHGIGIGQQVGDDIGCLGWRAGCGEDGCADLAQVFNGEYGHRVIG